MSVSDTEGNYVSEVSFRSNIVWEELKTKNQLVKTYFLAEHKDSRWNTKRKCIRCSAIVKASTNGTTNLVNHIKSCGKKLTQEHNQPSITGSFLDKLNRKAGWNKVARLVYEDSIPKTRVGKWPRQIHV